jgi:RNA-directed DNA polymerase
VISPLLANIALNGLERLLEAEDAKGKGIPPAKRKGLNRGVSLIRYADDFVVTAPSKEVLQNYVIPKITDFLEQRGLKLNEAKTRIVHVEEGFHFLGFEVRRFKDILLTKPQKEKVIQHLRSIKAYLNSHEQTPAGQVVRDLNPVLRGWANYYRHCAAKQTFNKADHRTWQMLWGWAKRRHPNKAAKWVRRRYFRDNGYWTFYEGNAQLLRRSSTPITRFTKVEGRATPFDPRQREYWRERRRRNVARQIYRKDYLELLRVQSGLCGLCQVPLTIENLDNHHRTPRSRGGSDTLDNRMLVHRWCHHAYHQRVGYQSQKA